MNFRLLPAAQYEADDAVRYYERQTLGLGDRFQTNLVGQFRRLPADARLYGRVDPPVRRREVRQAPVAGFSYTVIYDVRAAEVVVVAVAHTSRRPNYWRDRLP